MRIGFLADKVPYAERRGWGVYARQLITALLQIDAENSYRCFYNVVGRTRRKHIIASEGVALGNCVWPLPGRFMDLVWDRWRVLPVELFLGRVDVVHTPYELLPPVVSARTVVTVHDVTFLSHPEHLDAAFIETFTRRIRRIVSHANRIVTVSHSTKQELLDFTDVDEGRVEVIHNGVDEKFQPIDDNDYLRRVLQSYGVTQPYVLFVGAADEDKNLTRLAAAVTEIRQRAPEVRLVLAGRDSWGYGRLMKQLEQDGFAQGVHRTGFVADQDLPALYSGADVLAIPSIHEGFGLPALEAMACGTAVLASNVASFPEVVGDAGILVDPYSIDAIHDGLEQLLFNDQIRQRFEVEGLERSSTFSWKEAASRMLRVYKEVSS